MTSMWNDFKLKFLKSGNPALLYIGINALVFIIASLAAVLIFVFSGNHDVIKSYVEQYFAFPADPSLWLSRCYTLLTYQFFHADFFHILFNMLWLYWMGQLLLDFVKPRQFHLIYLGGGIIGAIFFALIFNIFPVFQPYASGATVIGASAAVMSVFTALATLVPNYSIRLLFIGDVKIKYLLFVYILLDLIAIQSANAGGNLAHLGGALFGFIYIKFLQSGTDLSMLFKRKPKMKVVRNENQKKRIKLSIKKKLMRY